MPAPAPAGRGLFGFAQQQQGGGSDDEGEAQQQEGIVVGHGGRVDLDDAVQGRGLHS